ncbi:MAG: hypothetical protein ACJ76F_08890, partial [Bacteroidia bacterium]
MTKIKLLISLIGLLFCTGLLKAQRTGVNCSLAIDIKATNTCSEQDYSGKFEHWFFFTADSATAQVLVSATNNSIAGYAPVSNISYFKGSCAGLTFLKSDTVITADSLFSYYEFTGLNIGDTCFILVQSSPGTIKLSMCMSQGTTPGVFTAAACKINCNGEFNQPAGVPANYLNPFGAGQVSCWQLAFGTPQIQTPAGNNAAYMWADRSCGGNIQSEGVMINFGAPLDPLATYYVRYKVTCAGVPNYATLDQFNVTLANAAGSGLPSLSIGCSPTGSSGWGGFIPPFSSGQAIDQVTNMPNVVNWISRGICFTPNAANQDVLVFYPVENTKPDDIQASVDLDSVEVIKMEDKTEPTVVICPGFPVQLNTLCQLTSTATYAWLPATNLSCTTCAQPLASPTVSTTYTCTVSFPGGCSFQIISPVNVIPPPGPIQANVPSPVCENTPFSGSVSPVTPGYTYQWTLSNGAVINSSSPNFFLSAGNYTYTVTANAPNCNIPSVATGSITVVAFPNPVISPVNSIICSNQSVVLNVTNPQAGVIYTWAPATGLNVTNGASVIASPQANQSYTVTADNGICTKVFACNVNVKPAPNVTVNSPNLCAGNSVNLTANSATAGVTYNWQPGNQNTQTINVSPNATTNYTVTVTAPNGCTASATSTVTVGNPTSGFNFPQPVCICDQICFTPTNVNPAYSYTWGIGTQGGSFNTVNNGAPVCLTYSSPAQFGASLTVSNGTCSSNTVQTFTISPLTVSFTYAATCKTIGFTPNVSCGGSNLTYDWDFHDGSPHSTAITPTHTFLNAGVGGSVTLTVHNGTCTGSITQGVTFGINPITISASAAPSTVCVGQQTSITANGTPNGLNYTWTSSPAGVYPGGSPITYIPTVPGNTTFTVTADNGKGCTKTATTVVTAVAAPPAVIGTTDTYVCYHQHGSTYTAQQTAGATYSWAVTGGTITAGQNTAAITVDWPSATAGGQVCLTVSNANGCTNSSCLPISPCCNYPSGTTVLNSLPANPINLSSGVITNGTSGSPNYYFLSGSFNVNNTVTFTNVVFYMNTGSKITVKQNTIPGGQPTKLTILNSHLWACTDMWVGIKLDLNTNFQGQETLIEDALIAIDMQDNGVQSQNTIDLQDVWFNRNGIGVKLTNCGANSSLTMARTVFTSRLDMNSGSAGIPYSASGPNYVPSFPTSTTVPNLTYTEGGLKNNTVYTHGARAQFGIHATNVPAGVIKLYKTNINLATRHLFDKLENGIYLNKTSANILYCDFKSIGSFVASVPIMNSVNAAVWIQGLTGTNTPQPYINVGDAFGGQFNTSQKKNDFFACKVGVWQDYFAVTNIIVNRFRQGNGKADVYINQLAGGTTGFTGNQIIRNHFENFRRVGVLAELNTNGNVTIQDNRFINGLFMNVSQPNIVPHAIAVKEANNPHNMQYDILNNFIQNFKEGISCENTFAAHVVDNEVQMIPDNVQGHTTYGIYLAACDDTQVLNNQCYDNNTDVIAKDWQYGIKADFSPNSSFMCNSLTGAGVSMGCFGQMASGIFNNQFVDAEKTNFLLSNNGFVGKQGLAPGSFPFTQGIPCNDVFSNPNTIGTYNPFTLFTANITFSGLFPWYYKNSFNPVNYIPYFNGDDGSGQAISPIGLNIAGFNFPCNFTPTPLNIILGGGNGNNQTDQLIAQNAVPFLAFQNVSRFHNENGLLRKLLLQNVNISGDPVLTAFKNTNQTGTIGTLLKVDTLINTGVTDSNIAMLNTVKAINAGLVATNAAET